MKWTKKFSERWTAFRKNFQPWGIQMTTMASFSAVVISIAVILGVVLYMRFSTSIRETSVERTEQQLEETASSLEDYLLSMRQISDSVYYNIIKNYDTADTALVEQMNLLYEANHDKILTIALYNEQGSLVTAQPVASQKEDPDVTRQIWFTEALDQVENLHFSRPHIQNLFDDGGYHYYTVISLSREVEFIQNRRPRVGVLLVDMNFSAIERILKRINDTENGQYYYLCDNAGNIVYHPRNMQISEGLFKENASVDGRRTNGVYDTSFGGKNHKVVVKTIGYTGWRLIGVIPRSALTYGTNNIRYFITMVVTLTLMLMLIVSRLVASRISRPILLLNDSVKNYEAGEKPEIYIGGSPEIRHLGSSIEKSYLRIDELMHQIVLEQNERRKSEIDAMQSQINPHFLYNTLDSITWMVEGEKNDEAVYMISQLARLLRISLSHGRTIISVRDEIQHAESYMNIQKIRYKDSFSFSMDIDPAIGDMCTVKLIIQPLLENAINYGVQGMDDDGEIALTGKMTPAGDIAISVTDNGMGIPEEDIPLLLTKNDRVHRHGNGVGLVNVERRIRLIFGEPYGLTIKSELDEGTTVTILLPAVPFTKENCEKLENG